MTRPIVVYGAGGHALDTLFLLEEINADAPAWEVLGFLDDRAEPGRTIHGLPVLGGVEWLAARPGRVHVVLGVGSPVAKRRMASRAEGLAAGFPVLLHPGVPRPRHATLGRGVAVTAGSVLTTDVVLGEFASVNLGCTVAHEAVVGAFATLAPGVRVSGNVAIGEGCDVGTGSVLLQGVGVGAWSVVGAGAVVTRDLPADCTAVGVPAKVIKTREPGWHLP